MSVIKCFQDMLKLIFYIINCPKSMGLVISWSLPRHMVLASLWYTLMEYLGLLLSQRDFFWNDVRERIGFGEQEDSASYTPKEQKMHGCCFSLSQSSACSDKQFIHQPNKDEARSDFTYLCFFASGICITRNMVIQPSHMQSIAVLCAWGISRRFLPFR